MKLLFLPTILFSFVIHSQEPAEGVFPLRDGAIYYEKIITLDSVSRESIYRAVKSWGVNAFKSQKDVLQADDKEIGLIAYKYWFSEQFHAITPDSKDGGYSQWRYDAIMKIFIKDGKVKIVVQDITLKSSDNYSGEILKLRANADSLYKDMQVTNKKFAKFMARYNTEEYKKIQYAEVKKNFESANKSILEMINQLAEYLKSSKSEFDF